MTLFVDHNALDNIVSVLAGASTSLDAVGNSAPGAVDGGDSTPALLGILARLAENAGQLVVALSAASDAVAEANAYYREQDVAAADALITEWAG